MDRAPAIWIMGKRCGAARKYSPANLQINANIEAANCKSAN
jgi:hypothetical protein